MGWYIRRSMKIAPGVRVNLSNRGLGVSVGTRGVHVSSSATGRQTFSAGIPGTGIRYRESLGTRKRSRTSSAAPQDAVQDVPQAREVTNLPAGVATTSVWRVLWWCVAVFLLFSGLGATFAPIAGTAWWSGPLEIALATAVIIQLRATRHLHRVERAPDQ